MSSSEQPPMPAGKAQIETRAYAIYCDRGCLDGADLEDWLEAERQIRAEAGIEHFGPSLAAPPEPASKRRARPARTGPACSELTHSDESGPD
ncbi:MAG: DUF2934 domain-containing protein [Dehalococcoidia bacterium]|nr:DUF2934 domain-containing protein [Dehalococcoidia bacterium]